MDILKLISRVESSEEYKNWRNSNENAYLSSIFTILESPEQEWHLNYYDADKEEIYSFTVGKNILIATHKEILSEEAPVALKPDKLTVPFDRILSTAKSFMNKKYSSFNYVKTMIVLQFLEGHQVWNISFFSKLMQTVNVRIDSSDGNILSHKPLSIIHFEDTKKE